MTRQLSIALLLFWIMLSCSSKDPYAVDNSFSKEAQTQIINQCVRYSTKLPPQATHQTKFDSEFNGYYDIATTEYDFRRCYPSEDGTYFFLMTRKARSIWPAREAIGGTLKVDANDKLLDYNEVFRTWKMTEDSLNTRSFELFDRIVKGEDLIPYQAKYKGDRYIEFPDDRYHFSAEKKRWVDSAMEISRVDQSGSF